MRNSTTFAALLAMVVFTVGCGRRSGSDTSAQNGSTPPGDAVANVGQKSGQAAQAPSGPAGEAAAVEEHPGGDVSAGGPMEGVSPEGAPNGANPAGPGGPAMPQANLYSGGQSPGALSEGAYPGGVRPPNFGKYGQAGQPGAPGYPPGGPTSAAGYPGGSPPPGYEKYSQTMRPGAAGYPPGSYPGGPSVGRRDELGSGLLGLHIPKPEKIETPQDAFTEFSRILLERIQKRIAEKKGLPIPTAPENPRAPGGFEPGVKPIGNEPIERADPAATPADPTETPAAKRPQSRP